MPATITVQALDANGEPIMVGGQENFKTDLAAVAQIIMTMLNLFQGEWWEDTTQGTPYFQKILGTNRTADAIAAVLKARLLQAPYVTDVTNVQCVISNRTLIYSAQAVTPFGTLAISTGGAANS